MKYTRIYGDSNRETHFEDVAEETQQTEIAPTVIMALTRRRSASNVFFVCVPSTYSDDFHSAPKRFIVAMLSGEFETTVSDDEVQRFGPRDVAPLDNLASKGHKSVAVGQSDCEIIFVGLGEHAS